MRKGRIRRTLALRVSEPKLTEHIDENAPGARFANGWAMFRNHGTFRQPLPEDFGGDAVVVAGYLAAQAAHTAHYNAVNWLEVRP